MEINVGSIQPQYTLFLACFILVDKTLSPFRETGALGQRQEYERPRHGTCINMMKEEEEEAWVVACIGKINEWKNMKYRRIIYWSECVSTSQSSEGKSTHFSKSNLKLRPSSPSTGQLDVNMHLRNKHEIE
jgi:hypothetical protein